MKRCSIFFKRGSFTGAASWDPTKINDARAAHGLRAPAATPDLDKRARCTFHLLFAVRVLLVAPAIKQTQRDAPRTRAIRFLLAHLGSGARGSKAMPPRRVDAMQLLLVVRFSSNSQAHSIWMRSTKSSMPKAARLATGPSAAPAAILIGIAMTTTAGNPR